MVGLLVVGDLDPPQPPLKKGGEYGVFYLIEGLGAGGLKRWRLTILPTYSNIFESAIAFSIWLALASLYFPPFLRGVRGDLQITNHTFSSRKTAFLLS